MREGVLLGRGPGLVGGAISMDMVPGMCEPVKVGTWTQLGGGSV
jgi:hypothetical protein